MKISLCFVFENHFYFYHPLPMLLCLSPYFFKGVRDFPGGSFSSALKSFCRQQRTGSILPNFSCLQGKAMESCSLNSWDDLPILSSSIACTGQQLNMQSSRGHFNRANTTPFSFTWHCQPPIIWVLAQGKAFSCFGEPVTLPASRHSKNQQ